MVNRRPRLRTKQPHLTALKYPPQSRLLTISTGSSPLQSWADTLLPRVLPSKQFESVTVPKRHVNTEQKQRICFQFARLFGSDTFPVFHNVFTEWKRHVYDAEAMKTLCERSVHVTLLRKHMMTRREYVAHTLRVGTQKKYIAYTLRINVT